MDGNVALQWNRFSIPSPDGPPLCGTDEANRRHCIQHNLEDRVTCPSDGCTHTATLHSMIYDHLPKCPRWTMACPCSPECTMTYTVHDAKRHYLTECKGIKVPGCECGQSDNPYNPLRFTFQGAVAHFLIHAHTTRMQYAAHLTSADTVREKQDWVYTLIGDAARSTSTRDQMTLLRKAALTTSSMRLSLSTAEPGTEDTRQVCIRSTLRDMHLIDETTRQFLHNPTLIQSMVGSSEPTLDDKTVRVLTSPRHEPVSPTENEEHSTMNIILRHLFSSGRDGESQTFVMELDHDAFELTDDDRMAVVTFAALDTLHRLSERSSLTSTPEETVYVELEPSV